MKYSIKFLTAALAVTALASCSDNLGYEGAISQPVNENDMSATLISPEFESGSTRVGITTTGSVVWAEDDEVRTYSLGKMTFNSYVLDENQNPGEGAGYDKASLKPQIIQNAKEESEYAVAQPKGNKDVRISATREGDPLLEAHIPAEYEWATVQDAGVAYKVPAPYWGKVVSTKPFACKFHALTSYIMLDLKDLPAGTQSIMLTTHEDFNIGTDSYAGGKNEPLSGGFEAVLYDENDGEDHEPAVLKKGELEATDYFRINFDASEVKEDKVLFIPVIAQKYEKLYVIAVKEYGKGRYNITEGEILKVWNNEEFNLNKVKPLYLGATIEYKGGNPAELSNLIALAYDGKHTVRVNVVDNPLASGKLFIANNTEKKNDVQITFKVDQDKDIEIVEAPVAVSGWFVNWGTPVDVTTANGDKARTVSVDFAEGSTAPGELNLLLPTSYVDISAEKDVDAEVYVLAAKSKNMAKPLSPARDVSTKKIAANEAKDAPIVIHSSATALTTYAGVFVYPASASSAVYVYNPETQITELGIGSTTPGSVRLTDALVGLIAYEATLSGGTDLISVDAISNIYTDGSSAIKNLLGGGNNVKLQADWTGRGLTVEAVANKYDQANIFTAAQLQGVGLAAGSGAGPAVYKYKIDDKVTDMWLGGEEYHWIGASMKTLTSTTNFTPKAPEEALTQDVEIDGNYKGLYNMKLTLDDPYYVDPHSCCTSCSSDDIKVTEDLGLIRDIVTTGTATVKNIRLNDVDIDTENYKVPNVGSLTGRIEAKKGITLNDNQTSNVRVSNVGGNAGGHVGVASTTLSFNTMVTTDDEVGDGNIAINKSVNKRVNGETGVDERFVKTVGSNAGGLVGASLAQKGTIRVTASEVDIQEVSATDGSNVGGIAGQAKYGKTSSFIGNTTVKVPVLFATEKAKEKTNKTKLNVNSGNNVGGLFGCLWNDNINQNADNIFGIRETIKVNVEDELTAENQFAGGLIGKLQMLASGKNDDAYNKAVLMIAKSNGAFNSDVNVDVKDLTAINGFAGGLVGKTVSGRTWILDEKVPNVSNVTVKIGSLNTAFAGAGAIGENLDYVTIQADDKEKEQLSVSVEAWKNTWAPGDKFDEGFAAIDAATLNKLCGSFAHIIGHQNENFDIYENFVTLTEAGGISDAVKKALFFQKHTDATNTVGDPSDKFWGDMNKYVGFSNKTGTYKINGTDPTHADQIYNYRTQY